VRSVAGWQRFFNLGHVAIPLANAPAPIWSFGNSRNHEEIVPARADDRKTLPESLACEVAGLAPPKRRDWVKRGVLDHPLKDAQLRELQVVELAVVRELHDVLGPRDATVVWKEIRESLRESVMADELFVVVDVAYREATLATSPEEVAAAVTTSRAVRVLTMGDLVQRVRAAFSRLAGTARRGDQTTGSATQDVGA
jgi:hypothetical protein